MDSQGKAAILREIMGHMQKRDGARLKPKPPTPAPMAAPQAPSPTDPSHQIPGMAEGGVVEADMHSGAEGDLSPEDAHILESLWGTEGSEGHNEADDDDEDDKAGNV